MKSARKYAFLTIKVDATSACYRKKKQNSIASEDKVQGQRCYLQFVDSINLSRMSKVKFTRYFMIY